MTIEKTIEMIQNLRNEKLGLIMRQIRQEMSSIGIKKLKSMTIEKEYVQIFFD